MSQEHKQICNTCGTVNDTQRKNCTRCGSLLDEPPLQQEIPEHIVRTPIFSFLEKYENVVFSREMHLEAEDMDASNLSNSSEDDIHSLHADLPSSISSPRITREMYLEAEDMYASNSSNCAENSHMFIGGDKRQFMSDSSEDDIHSLHADLPSSIFSPHVENFVTTIKRRFPIRRKNIPILLFILLLILAPTFYLLLRTNPKPSSPSISLPKGLGVIKAPNGQYVGINDGSFQPFDVGPSRSDSSDKEKGAQLLKQGNPQGAMSLWETGLKSDTNDAEALIYRENQRVIASGNYITLVLGLTFTPPFPDITSQSGLQGAYIAQEEFNAENHSIKLRLLISSTAGDITYIVPIAQQIVQIAQQDHTVLGVLGWQTSTNTLNALHILADAKIPVISSTASSDDLTNISPYFYRMVPPNTVQGTALLSLTKRINVTKAVVFVDTQSNYSQNITQAFEQGFKSDGHQILKEETFTTNKTTVNDFIKLIHDALNYKPDVLFFAGSTKHDVERFQDALPPTAQFPPGLSVISDDAGYVAKPNAYGHWYFTAFAYPDEWEIVTGNSSPFSLAYANALDPNHQYKLNAKYGFTRPEASVILAYDAASVVMQGIRIMLASNKTSPKPQDLAAALSLIKDTQGVQGTSGYISFGSDHNPIDKAIVILKVSSQGNIQLICIKGGFLPAVDHASYSCPS
jgi:ABC-type branched-subunit amino acid transport system substrate-binding protein